MLSLHVPVVRYVNDEAYYDVHSVLQNKEKQSRVDVIIHFIVHCFSE